MTVRITHKNSSRSAVNPRADQLAYGELAINYNEDGPFLSVRDSNDRIVRVGGVWINDNSPVNPAHGSLWVDSDNNQLYIWDEDTNSWRQLSGSGGGGGGGGAVNSVTSGDGIDHQPALGTGNVVISADIDTNRGLEFVSGQIAVNLGTGLEFSGSGEIQTTGGALTFVGPVDVTDETTRPTSADVGDVFINTGDGNVDSDWANRLSNATTATDSDPGDLVVCTAAATSQATGTYTLVTTGGQINVDLDYTKAADKGTVTNTAGSDAEIPFADENFAGLFIEPDNGTAGTTETYVRQSANVGGTQTHTWVEAGNGTVTSIAPGDGLQNGDGTQNAITAGGSLAIDLQIAGPGAGGLELTATDGTGEVRVNAGQGIELTAGGVAADLGAGLNFDVNGQIQIDAANMPAPGNDQSFGYWTRENDDSTLTPRTGTDIVMLGGGSATNPTLAHTGDLNTGIAFAADDQVNLTARGQEKLRVTGTAADTGEVIVNPGNINCDFRVESDTPANDDVLFVDTSADRVGIGEGTPEEMLHVNGDARVDGHLNLDTAGQDLIFTGTDNTAPTPNERTISIQAPTGAAGFDNSYTVTLPSDVPQANEILQVTAVDVNRVATTAWNAAPNNGITVQDDGNPLLNAATTLNFVGNGVTATGNGATKTITIPGGGGGNGGGAVNDVQVARLVDQKASGTAGGAAVAGWQERTLNTEVYDDDSLVTIPGTNDRFTLAAGEYLVEWSVPAVGVGDHKTALSTTDNIAQAVAFGSSEFASVNDEAATCSTGSFRVAAGAARTYHLLHFCQNAQAGNGLGVPTNSGAGQPEIYTQVDITNLAGVTVNAAGDVNHITYNGAAAWASFNGTAAIGAQPIFGRLNVSSITKTAAGTYDVVFANPMGNANYSVTSNGYSFTQNRTPNGFRIIYKIGGDAADANQDVNPGDFAVHALNALPPMGGTGTDAWASAQGDGTINASFNVASITRTGRGVYSVVFTTPMPNANYAVNCASNSNSRFTGVKAINRTTTGFVINTQQLTVGSQTTGGDAVDEPFSFAVNGSNATLPLTITEDQIAALIQNPVLSAWGNLDGNGVLQKGFNCTTSKIDPGKYKVTFVNPMPDANYSVVAQNRGPSNTSCRYTSLTANDFIIETLSSTASFNDAGVSFQVAGTARNGTLGGGADAWARCNSNSAILGSFNVEGVSQTVDIDGNAVAKQNGTYYVRFANPMPNGGYAVAVSAQNNQASAAFGGPTANGFRVVLTRISDNTAQDYSFAFAVFATDGNAGGFWVSTGQGANEVLKPLNPQADVQVPSLNGGPLAGLRSRIINGCGSAAGTINQRGYVSGTATTAANEYTIDRWRVVTSGQSLSWADANNIRTLTAPAGGVEQIIEGANITAGQYTLSWTGTATATVAIGANAAAAVANGGNVTITAAQSGSNVTVRLINGTFHSVQFEPGPVATPFEHRPIGTELALCQRYYQRISLRGSIFNLHASSSDFAVPFSLAVTMRKDQPDCTSINNQARLYYSRDREDTSAGSSDGHRNITSVSGASTMGQPILLCSRLAGTVSQNLATVGGGNAESQFNLDAEL